MTELRILMIDFCRVVIPKEIRFLRTMILRIAFCSGMQEIAGRGYIG